MSNCNNFYDKFAIKNVVDDSVDAHSDSVTISSFQFFITHWARIFRQVGNGLFDISVERLIDFC